MLQVNITKKKFGVRTGLDLTAKEYLELKDMLTLRIVMSVVSSVYDPLGMICPITIRMKLLLQETHQIPDVTWDKFLPSKFQER